MSKSEYPVIRQFTVADEQAVAAAQTEVEADDVDFLVGRGRRETWPDFVHRLGLNRSGAGLPEGMVASGNYGAFLTGQLAGRVSVRYELNDYLRDFAGHVGFVVRPAFRGRGIATALCRHALAELAGRGVKQALITCDETNAASRATIVKCGGVPDERRPVALYQQETRVLRFWVPTS